MQTLKIWISEMKTIFNTMTRILPLKSSGVCLTRTMEIKETLLHIMSKYFPAANQALPIRMTAIVFRAKCQRRSIARNQRLAMERMTFDSNPQSPAHKDGLQGAKAIWTFCLIEKCNMDQCEGGICT
jgi:hypothetical protein